MTNKLLADINLGNITGVGKFQQGTSDPLGGTEKFLSILVAAITAVSGIAFLFYFLIGALNWVTAGGEKGKVETAQKTMTNAAIGLIAVIVAYFIAGVVGTILNIDILNPATILKP